MDKKLFISLIALAGLSAAIYWLQSPESARQSLAIGTAAPEHDWSDVSGQATRLSYYRGRVVLLDFWATWCASCQEELPALQKVYGKYHNEGLELLAPSVDETGRKALIPYLANHSIPWKVLLSDDQDIAAYHINGLPTKYLIDRHGVIVREYIGPVNPEELQNDIRMVLKKENT